MNEQLKYRIDPEIKTEYDDFIKEKYGHKRNRCGSEIEKLIKLYLAMNKPDSYQDDPDVKELLDILVDKTSAHSQKGASGRSNMDLFAQAFVKEHKDRKQVTRSELSYFASFTQCVTDHRAIQNRINYLIGSGVLVPMAPNVFEIQKIGDNVGFR